MEPTIVPWGRLLVSLLAMAVLMVILVLCMRFVRGRGLGRHPLLHIVSMVGVGPKERLMLVHVDDKVLLLGVTAGSIAKLHEFDSSLLLTSPDSDASQGSLWQQWKNMRHRGHTK
jgi:flagellar protein FliO/FliZ